jgi:lactate permease
MGAVPVSFGAVGTPTWFGLGQLGLEKPELLEIGFRTALINGGAALVIPLVALAFVVTWREILANLVFIYLSILACTLPYLALAAVSYELPSLLGGMVGLALSIVLARAGVGLARSEAPAAAEPVRTGELVRALFPIWCTVLVLVLTRIEPLGLKALLTMPAPVFETRLGSLGELSVSPSLVLGLSQIFGSAADWSMRALYVPALIPFLLVSLLSLPVLGLAPRPAMQVFADTGRRMHNTVLALLGALVLVKLLMVGGEASMVMIIGRTFGNLAGDHWRYLAPYLGALGTFFSGSATISNLTFAGIQSSIAQGLGLDQSMMLTLQAAGAAMGSMISINNCVAVCSIVGLANGEGAIIRRTLWPMLLYGVIAAGLGQLLFTP